MGKSVIVSEMTSGTNVLETTCVRFGCSEGRIAVTLDGSYSQAANSLKRDVIYILSIEDESGVQMREYCRFLSYTCQYSISVADKNQFVITDNTMLFEKMV